MTDSDVTVPTHALRVIYESPPLGSGTDSEDAQRRAEVFAQGDRAEVAIVDGFGAQVVVERGHLELRDGVSQDRRLRRYSKIDPPRRVVVGIGTVGMVSLDAIRWCTRVGTPLVVLGDDGALLAAGPPGRDDARLLRAQALALYGPVGLAVTQYLIGEKLRGQAELLRLHFGEDEAASTIMDLAAAVESVETIEECRQLEAAGANVYFAAFERRVEVTFARKDLPRVPAHWLRFNGRRSAINPGSPRSACDVAGAVANYSYKLAEIEASLATQRIGLSASIGILHSDVIGRPSFACDLMEAVRPVVDAHVLDVLDGPLRKREFSEDARGVVRCLAPITHRLAEAMPSYAMALGPVTEHVAELLAQSSPYDVKVPTVLSGSKHKAAARTRSGSQGGTAPAPRTRLQGPNPGNLAPRGRRRPKPSVSPPLPLRACLGCGGELPIDQDRDRPRINWCPQCLASRRNEIGASMAARGRVATERIAEKTGVRPTHTKEARRARAEANSRQREEERRWKAHRDRANADSVELQDHHWYESEIQPRLGVFSLPAIARSTGSSTTSASQWRAGKRVPHKRHWKALAELVGVPCAI
jgi:CRISPR-associated endonuclease Cas1